MQVSVETTSGLERRLIVGVPAEKVDTAVNAKLQEAAKTVRLNGFRPGKVPMRVLKQRFGASVRMEVLNEVMNESFYQAIQEQNLTPAGQPSIEPKNMDEGKDVEFVATFEVFPEIETKDYTSLEVVRPQAEVTESDIDDMIDNLRQQRASFETVERAAESGDKVVLDYTGTKDGEAFEGGSAEKTELELGSGRMIPGFEDGLIGLSAGDEKTLALTFPEDYHAEELKGAAVEFAVKVHEVKAKQLPELNEELFEQFGVKEGGVDAFRAEVRKNMERELERATRNRVKNQVMDGILASHGELQIPKALVAQEIEALRQQSVQQFGAMAEQLDVKALLPDEMFTEQAEKRVRLGLILNEIINQNEVQADADKVKAAIEEMAQGYEEKDAFIQWMYGNQEQLRQVESMVVEDQLVDDILEKATVQDESMSYQEAMTPAAEIDEDSEEGEDDPA